MCCVLLKVWKMTDCHMSTLATISLGGDEAFLTHEIMQFLLPCCGYPADITLLHVKLHRLLWRTGKLKENAIHA